MQLKQGIQVDWSFVSRLTRNQQLADIGVGDRTLAIWLGRGFYHFCTTNGGNPNDVRNVNHPADIEGLWTFIYFSHSLNDKQTAIFARFGNEKLIKVIVPAVHVVPSYLKFYLGGNNMNYAAFNGQFSDVIFSTGKGAFKNQDADIEKLLETLKKPADFN